MSHRTLFELEMKYSKVPKKHRLLKTEPLDPFFLTVRQVNK